MSWRIATAKPTATMMIVLICPAFAVISSSMPV